MINTVVFRERNPNYFFPPLDKKLSQNDMGFRLDDISNFKDNSSGDDREITKRKTTYTTEKLILCSATIYRFYFLTKR